MPRPQLVHQPRRGQAPDRGLAGRLQPASTPHQPAHGHTSGLRCGTTIRQAATGSGSRALRGLTAGTRCRPHPAGAIRQSRIPLRLGPTLGAGSFRIIDTSEQTLDAVADAYLRDVLNIVLERSVYYPTRLNWKKNSPRLIGCIRYAQTASLY